MQEKPTHTGAHVQQASPLPTSAPLPSETASLFIQAGRLLQKQPSRVYEEYAGPHPHLLQVAFLGSGKLWLMQPLCFFFSSINSYHLLLAETAISKTGRRLESVLRRRIKGRNTDSQAVGKHAWTGLLWLDKAKVC